MKWSNKDPREVINKRDHIIIVRPDDQGQLTRVSSAFVDSKESYCVFTNFPEHHLNVVYADMEWDPLWYWIFAPEKPV